MTTLITPLPTPPTRQDSSNFNDRADEFLGALPLFQQEANGLAIDVQSIADEVEISRQAVVSVTNITKWVSGNTYPEGASVWSPINGVTYRKVTSSVGGTTDPSNDATNYKSITDAAGFTYTQLGTGAVTTTVQSKLRETVSVKDFGADPTATAAANVTAFQRALAYLQTVGGGLLRVPASTYQLNGTITVPSNITLQGDNRNASSLNFVGVSGLKSANGSQHVVISDLYILGNDTAGTYGVEIDNNPRGTVLRNLFVRRFGTAGNGAGVYLHNTTTFDMWNSHLETVVIEDCGRGFVLSNAQATVLLNCIARLNAGDSLYASGCVNLNVLGGTYENPSGASAPQINIHLNACKQVLLDGVWSENAITRNLLISGCSGVVVDGCLLNNITSTGYGNEISGASSYVRFNGTRIIGVESGEVGILIDSGCTVIDTSGLYGESLDGALFANRTLNSILLSSGFTIPSGTNTPTQSVYFVTSSGAVASDASFAFLDGVNGFQTTIINTGANEITIRNGANVKLNGATNYVMGQNDSLTIVFSSTTGFWHEVARSNN